MSEFISLGEIILGVMEGLEQRRRMLTEIETEEEYEEVLGKVAVLLDEANKPIDTEEEMERLIVLIEAYQDKHYPMGVIC
jgi:antitoxin component HigA of HigAB toxin-antitoxin module